MKKECGKCQEPKELIEFSSSYVGQLGVNRYCKKCVSLVYRQKKNHKPVIVDDLDGEVWKDVVGYNGHYQISNKGRIKGLYRMVKCAVKGVSTERVEHGGLLKLTVTHSFGYYHVSLKLNSKITTFTVHRLVALSFVENTNNLNVVNHLDSNPKNNNSDNLEWTTTKGNARHAVKCGRIKTGNSHHNSKSVIRYSVSGDKLDEFGSLSVASDITGACRDGISHCLSGKTKSSGGFIWKYKT